jgi:HAD superfamily hydrolase (TIGR01458 family)
MLKSNLWQKALPSVAPGGLVTLPSDGGPSSWSEGRGRPFYENCSQRKSGGALVDQQFVLMQYSDMIKGVLLDISGVLSDGDAAMPGAVESVLHLRAAEIAIRFLTNTTRQSKRRLIHQLQSFGISAAADEVFTPVAAARAWLNKNGCSPHLLVHPDLEEDFADCRADGPVAVVLGDAAQRFTYDGMNAAFRELQNGAPFLALARNRMFRDVDGRLSLDAGPFVEALEYASGTKARLFGKPSPDFFLAAVASMGCDPVDAAMVGDDAESDVAGALSAGVGKGILVRSGKYRPGDENIVKPEPSVVVEDIRAAVGCILKMCGR